MKKKGIIAILIIVGVATVGFLSFYSNKTNKADNANVANTQQQDLFLFKNSENGQSKNVSVLENGKVIELGTTYKNHIYILSDENDFLLIQKNNEQNDTYNLVVVNEDRAEKIVGSVSTSELDTIKCLNGYIYYQKEGAKGEESTIEINPRLDGKIHPETVIEGMDFVLYSNDKRVVGTNSKKELVEYDRLTKKVSVIGQRFASLENKNEVVLISSNGEVIYYNLITGEKILDTKKIPDINGEITKLYTLGYIDGKLLYYKYDNELGSSYDIYSKEKNAEPVLISKTASNAEIIGNSLFYSKGLINNGVLEQELVQTSLDNISDSKVLLKSNIISDTVMTKDGEVYTLAGTDGNLYKISKDGKANEIASGVGFIRTQGNNIIYAKRHNQLKDKTSMHQEAYDIYIGNKEIAKEISKIYFVNDDLVYRDGQNTYMIHNGQNQKLNIDASKYTDIVESDGMVNSLKLRTSDIEGYWKMHKGYKTEYLDIDRQGNISVVGEKILEGKKYTEPLEDYSYILEPTETDKAVVKFIDKEPSGIFFSDSSKDVKSSINIEMENNKEIEIEGEDITLTKISKQQYIDEVSKILTKNELEDIAKKGLRTNEVKLIESKEIDGIKCSIYESVVNPSSKIIVGEAGGLYNYDAYLKNNILMEVF